MILFPTDIIVHKERGVKFDIYVSYLLFHLPGSHPLRDQNVSYTFRKNESNEWNVINQMRPWYKIDSKKCTDEEIKQIKSVQKHFEDKNGEVDYCMSQIKRGKTPYLDLGLPDFTYYTINDDGIKIVGDSSRTYPIIIKEEFYSEKEDHSDKFLDQSQNLPLHSEVDYSELFLGPVDKQQIWIENCESSMELL